MNLVRGGRGIAKYCEDEKWREGVEEVARDAVVSDLVANEAN